VFLDIKLKTLMDKIATQEVCDSISEMRKIIVELIQKSRTLTFDLSDPVLNELGLEAAIERRLVKYVEQEHGLNATFSDDQEPKPLEEDVKVMLFKAVKELLANIIKHANATKVQVSVVRDGNDIAIRVDDDGTGFDCETIDAYPNVGVHYGLFSIRERLDYSGGSLIVESKAGMGTKVLLRAPLKNESGSEKI
jgi:signal transduction histidine kinase